MTGTEIERMIVRLVGDGSSFQAMLREAAATTKATAEQVKIHTKAIEDFGSRLNGLGGRIGQYASQVGALVGITSVMGAVGLGVSLAADAEQAQIAFKVMLGSVSEAKRLLEQLTTFAATTPFELPEVRAAGQALLAFGISAKGILPALKAIGDVSAGVGQPIKEISVIYGKAKVAGRLFAEDINQLTERGIPVIQELAKQFGVTEGEVRKLVEKGEVHFSHLKKAFDDLTGKGGKFANMMKEQSDSAKGAFSNLKDAVGLALTQLGDDITKTFQLREVMASVSAAAKTVQGWLAGLSPQFKTLAAAVVIGTGAFLALAGSATLLIVAGTKIAAVWSNVALHLNKTTTQAWLATAATRALAIATGVGLVAALVTTVHWLLGGHSAMERYNKATQEGIRLVNELAAATGKRHEEKRKDIGGIADNANRKKALEDELAKAERDLQAYEAMVNKSKAEFGAQFLPPGFWDAHIGGGASGDLKAELEQNEALLAEAKAHAAALQDELTKLGEAPVVENAKATESFKKLEAELQKEIATIDMTKNQQERYTMSLAGNTEAQIDEIYYLQEKRDALVATKEAQAELDEGGRKLTKDINDLNMSLDRQIATFDMTSEQIALYDLRMRNASEAEIASSVSKTGVLEGMKKKQELVEKAKALAKSALKPEEKLAEQRAELDELLAAGAIEIDAYNQALKEAEQQAHKDYTADFNTTGVDAVAADSADAMAALREFQLGSTATPGMRGYTTPAPIPPDPELTKWPWEDADTALQLEQDKRKARQHKANPMLAVDDAGQAAADEYDARQAGRQPFSNDKRSTKTEELLLQIKEAIEGKETIEIPVADLKR